MTFGTLSYGAVNSTVTRHRAAAAKHRLFVSKNAFQRINFQLLDEEEVVKISMDVPGIKGGDLLVSIQDDVLTVSGTRHMQLEQPVRFSKSFALSKTIDTANMTANLFQGVLIISAPKKAKVGPITVSVTEHPHAEEGNDIDNARAEIEEEYLEESNDEETFSETLEDSNALQEFAGKEVAFQPTAQEVN